MLGKKCHRETCQPGHHDAFIRTEMDGWRRWAPRKPVFLTTLSLMPWLTAISNGATCG